MSMEMFDNVLENIDENYPLSLSPTLILALLVSMGICVIALRIIFIWYKRKASLTSSTVGNLVKLVPSLNDKVSTLNCLLPILSELASPKNTNKTIITPTTFFTLQQTTLDELILPPVLISWLQVAASAPLTSAINQSTHIEPGPKQVPKDETTEPVSLFFEMFNEAADDLNTKGIINLKKYNRYLVKKMSKPI